MTATITNTPKAMEVTAALPEIPFIDIREKSPIDIVKEYKDRCKKLVKSNQATFGFIAKILSYFILPVTDFFAGRWLKKSKNPYRDEIAKLQKASAKTGVKTLNLSYEWGCTSGVYSDGTAAKLTRVLDWPCPALGETIVVAHQKGAAGEYHNITWPGVSGIFNAVAKGRFAAALNQAPMRLHNNGVLLSWLRNRIKFYKSNALPPAHLLRKVFDEAKSYDEAKKILVETPIALPVLFTLSGTNPGEGCVIERLENQAVVRELQGGIVTTTNHFESNFNGIGSGWLPRAEDSCARSDASKALPHADVDDKFSWYKAPVANEYSRLAMVANAATGELQVMGTLGAKPVTQVFKI